MYGDDPKHESVRARRRSDARENSRVGTQVRSAHPHYPMAKEGMGGVFRGETARMAGAVPDSSPMGDVGVRDPVRMLRERAQI